MNFLMNLEVYKYVPDFTQQLMFVILF